MLTSLQVAMDSLSLLLTKMRQHKGKSFVLGVANYFIIRYIFILLKRKFRREPPGPIGLPLIGCAHMRGTKGDFATRLAKQYGPIVQLQMGASRMILLNHSAVVREVLMTRALNDRTPISRDPNTFHLLATDSNMVGFLQLNGDSWRQRRRFALSLLANIPSATLRQIGTDSLGRVLFPRLDKIANNYIKKNQKNKNKTSNSNLDHSKQSQQEQSARVHVSDLSDFSDLSNVHACEWDIRDDMMFYAFNTLYQYNVGKACRYEDEIWKNMAQMAKKMIGLFTFVVWYNIFPSLRRLERFQKNYVQARKERTDQIRLLLQRHSEVKKNEENEKNEEKSKGKHEQGMKGTYIEKMLEFERNGEMTRDEILADINALFTAGTETTSATLEMAVLLLAKHQDVQMNIRNCLINLWRQHGSPLMAGTAYKEFGLEWKLDPKTKQFSNEFGAFCLEMMRIASVAGRGVEHCATKNSFDIEVKKEYGTKDGKDHTYRIDKGTTLIYNTEFIQLHSKFEKEWKHKPDSDDICLENWLETDEHGTTKLIKTAKMPYTNFGIGKRDCVGRRLAENEVEMFLGAFLLNYKVSFDEAKYGKDAKKVKIGIRRQTSPRIEPKMTVVLERFE